MDESGGCALGVVVWVAHSRGAVLGFVSRQRSWQKAHTALQSSSPSHPQQSYVTALGRLSHHPLVAHVCTRNCAPTGSLLLLRSLASPLAQLLRLTFDVLETLLWCTGALAHRRMRWCAVRNSHCKPSRIAAAQCLAVASLLVLQQLRCFGAADYKGATSKPFIAPMPLCAPRDFGKLGRGQSLQSLHAANTGGICTL